ncbi:hypothetical protein DFA_09156 [Cavenderia fasciculata]|uniref:Uncharacterized protein n=1 Tax=Cavenderia fasciculata TaxID=261658 RepID=F4Q6U9_CACFS|nr:uncharacterized protein DFA_09156 [Cavenderia fasciculata]EGG16131.1 hypothetical protein DFA_09156 [Cavenderia fasciculata]|eukprot:XP_004352584.1 hypothetical protein DFA_09156 [Cavenderia fasciculata]
MPREKFEKSVWSHINNQYNGIKVANRIYLPPYNQLYLDAPPWFVKTIEHVTIDHLNKTSVNLVKLSKLANLKSLVYLGNQNPEFGALTSLTSIDSQFHRYSIEDLVPSLNRPMTKLLFHDPSVILKAKDIVLESLQVIKLDVKLYNSLFQNNGNHASQVQVQPPRTNLPNLRHVHIEFENGKEISSIILPDRITTVTTTKYSNGDADMIDFATLATICNQLNQQSKLSRIVVYSKRNLTDVQHQQLLQSNIYFNSSKDMCLGQDDRNYIFYRNDQHNNQIINNINSNNNSNIINNNNNNIPLLLPNIIIYKIIKLLWNSMNRCNCDSTIIRWYHNSNGKKDLSNRDIILLKSNQDFESIQSNCPHHCWFDRSSLFIPLDRHHQKYLQVETIKVFNRLQDNSIIYI